MTRSTRTSRQTLDEGTQKRAQVRLHAALHPHCYPTQNTSESTQNSNTTTHAHLHVNAFNTIYIDNGNICIVIKLYIIAIKHFCIAIFTDLGGGDTAEYTSL